MNETHKIAGGQAQIKNSFEKTSMDRYESLPALLRHNHYAHVAGKLLQVIKTFIDPCRFQGNDL